MPTIDINFVGPLRLFVGIRSVSIKVTYPQNMHHMLS